MTEAQHQAAVFKWTQQPAIREKWPELKLLFHIPNGGTRDPVEGRHLKAQGVRRGVPDLFLPVARGAYCGLFIEMKSEKGRASFDQRWWLSELEGQGYRAEICHGWRQAVEVLEAYMNGETEIYT